MKGKEKTTTPAPGSGWTKPDIYIGALARKRSYRHAREGEPRTTPRPGISSIPLAAILAILAVLVVAIMVVAFPGRQVVSSPKPPAAQERGVAAPGWFQEAQKEMHR